jgi:hypothetical protein
MLLGNFALDRAAGFTVVHSTDRAVGRDLTKEGYPFFTGSVSLRKKFTLDGTSKDRIWLTFERLDATFARIKVNGVVVGDLSWEPYAVEITSAARSGENELEVELVTTRHNLFGPHHDRRGEVTKFAAPHIWTNETMWTDDYYFAPVGVTGARIGFAGGR